MQRLDDLVVAEVEHAVPLFDDGDLGAERGEHRRVLDADDAGADHDERCGDGIEREDRRRSRRPSRPSKATRVGPRRAGAGGDDDPFGADLAVLAAAGGSATAHGVRVDEARRTRRGAPPGCGRAGLRTTSISRLMTCWVRAERSCDGDVVLDPVALPVQLALRQAGEVEHGLPQRLRRNRAGIDAYAADIVATRSTTATRLPSLAAAMAAFWPPGPHPITSTS